MVVALGTNMKGGFASLETLLEAALARLEDEGLAAAAKSSWWASRSWPDTSAPAYRNGVALVQTGLGPDAVLGLLAKVEALFGRSRAEPNAPRTLDLDLIAHGRTVLDAPGLVLPHPRAHLRRFVMGPLAEIAPDWRHPITGERADALAARSEIGADARPVVATANAGR